MDIATLPNGRKGGIELVVKSIHEPTPTQKDNDVLSLNLPTQHTVIDASLMPQLIELYFDHKRPSLGGRTERTYRDHIRPFVAFWNDCHHIHEQTISVSVMRQFHDWLRNDYKTARNTPPAENTISHCLTVVKQLFEWMYRSECTDGVPIQKWVPHVPLVQPEVYFPTKEELQLLIDQVVGYDGPWRLRDASVITFALSTGARATEIAKAKIENLTFVDTPIDDVSVKSKHRGYVYLENVKGDMEGTKNKGRYVVFGSKAGLFLKCWMRYSMRTSRIYNFEHGHAIYQMIGRHIDRIENPGEATAFSAQSLRRAFSDNWDAVGGVSKRLPLKLQMGHSLKGDVTQAHYINGQNKRRIAQQILEEHISPLDNLEIDWTRFPVTLT